MKMEEIRCVSNAELKNLLVSLRGRLFDLKVKSRLGAKADEGVVSRKAIRRDIARILTWLKSNMEVSN